MLLSFRLLCVLASLFTVCRTTHAASPTSLALDDEMRELTFLGYTETATTARVWIKTTEPVTWHMDTSHPGLVIVTLTHTRIAHANNERPLDTRFFDGPITSIAAQYLEGPSGAVRILINCDAPTEAKVSHDDVSLYIDVAK